MLLGMNGIQLNSKIMYTIVIILIRLQSLELLNGKQYRALGTTLEKDVLGAVSEAM